MAFNAQPTLQGPTLGVRPLVPDDYDALQAAASDPGIWAGHPNPAMFTPEVFRGWFDQGINSGMALAVVDAGTGALIGSSRYYLVETLPEAISIGYTFLVRDHWGGASNRALKSLMLDNAFQSFDAVWFHVAPVNIRSQKATMKLGAVFTHEEKLALTGPASDWFCYRLDRDVWNALGATA